MTISNVVPLPTVLSSADSPVRIKACRHGTLMYNLHDQYVGRSLDVYGEFSELESKLFEQILRPGMAVFDVGANIGAHTVALAKIVGSEGQIVAFEPQRIVYQMLCGNLALNNIGNVMAMMAGVGAKVGSVNVPTINYSQPGNFGGVSLPINAQPDAKLEIVPLLTIDSFQFPRCHFMKIDIEGMELEALKGAKETLQRCRPMLYVENDRTDRSLPLITYLFEAGYKLYWHLPPLFNPDNFCRYGGKYFSQSYFYQHALPAARTERYHEKFFRNHAAECQPLYQCYSMTICRLSNRGVLRIGGDDRRAFLQGLISNDIELCRPDKAIYAALLTPQGKFLHDMFVVDAGDCFLIDCEAARTDDLLQRLKAHKLRAKVTFENVSEAFSVWAGWDELEHASCSEGRTNPLPLVGQGTPPLLSQNHSYNDPRLAALGSRIILPKNAEPEGCVTDFAAYDRHRLMLGAPDGSRDMVVEKSTLLEGNFDLLNGISWSKGCYMGQELTARMHYRALVKKRLLSVTIEGPAPTLGEPVTLNGEEVGEMRSSCGDRGLALLSMEKHGGVYLSGGSKLTAHQPDYFVTVKEKSAT